MQRRRAFRLFAQWSLTTLVVALCVLAGFGYAREVACLLRVRDRRMYVSVDKSALWVQILPVHHWSEPSANDSDPPSQRRADIIKGLRAQLLANEVSCARLYFTYSRNQEWLWSPGVFFNTSGIDTRLIVAPFWIPGLLAGTFAGLLWRRSFLETKRLRAGLCPRCRYDRRGLPTAVTPCPECGVIPASWRNEVPQPDQSGLL